MWMNLKGVWDLKKVNVEYGFMIRLKNYVIFIILIVKGLFVCVEICYEE